ncbi:MAG: hypothetical protein JXA78_03795 [Anaerolineales bacterium]|nr:hypothetical protein [Anaerolineales bacterium]
MLDPVQRGEQFIQLVGELAGEGLDGLAIQRLEQSEGRYDGLAGLLA